jgi:hypothetical protein
MLLSLPMLLLVVLLLLALLFLASLHYECCSMISLLLLFSCTHAGKVFRTLEGTLFYSPMPENSGPWSQARSPSRDQTFTAWRTVKCVIPGTGRLFRL